MGLAHPVGVVEGAGPAGAPAELAREITQQRRGDSRAWLAMARVVQGPEALEERLAALDQASALAHATTS